MAGVKQRNRLLKKNPTDVKKEIKEAIQQTNGKRLIIGPGCAMPIDTPEANIIF